MKKFILNLLNFAVTEFGIIDEQVKKELKAKVDKKIAEKIADINIDDIMNNVDFTAIIKHSLESNTINNLSRSIDSILQEIFTNIRYNNVVKDAYNEAVINSIKGIIKE